GILPVNFLYGPVTSKPHSADCRLLHRNILPERIGNSSEVKPPVTKGVQNCGLHLVPGGFMGTQMRPADGAMTLAEMKEFAAFPAATQRYIRRSLDVGLGRDDALARWSRDVIESASIMAQARIYARL